MAKVVRNVQKFRGRPLDNLVPILDFTGGATLQTAQHGRQFWLAGSVTLYVVGVPFSVASQALQVVSECPLRC